MRAIIIDDEKANIENLQFLLKNHPSGIEIIATARTIEEARNNIIQLQPDLIFLDILLGDRTSFELLQSLPHQNFEIIFITAYDRYGIQAVKFAALDYILKPIDAEELMIAIQKAKNIISQKAKNIKLEYLLDILSQKDQKPSKIVLPLQDEIRYIEINDIVYCESSNTYTNFHLCSGEKILVSKPLKEYELMLTPYNFIRTHQSYLVNSVYIILL